MPIDPTQINNTIANAIKANGRGAITAGVLASVLGSGGLTAWVSSNAAHSGANTDITSIFGTIHNITEGSPCNNPANDDGANLQAWLNGLPIGVTVHIPANTFCSLLSANLVLPKSIHLIGPNGWNSGPPLPDSGVPIGGGFFEKPPYHIQVASGDVLENLGVYRSTADGYFHLNPTLANTLSDLNQWWQEMSVGIEDADGANVSGVRLKGVFVEGFHVCVSHWGSRLDIHELDGDCPSLVAYFRGGDTSYVSDIRAEPYYGTGQNSQSSGAWQRYGTAFYAGADGTNYLNRMQAEGWPQAYVIADGGTYIIDQVIHEYTSAWADSPTGYPAENYGVTGHLIHTSDMTWLLNQQGGGSGTPTGVYRGGIAMDAVSNVAIKNIGFASMPAGGFAVYGSGGTAAATILTLNSLPAVGTAISITFGGNSITAVGGPYTINYTTQADDTSADHLIRKLKYLLLTQYSALAFAHVTASSQNAGLSLTSSQLSIEWPADATVNVSVGGGASITLSTGNTEPGSFGALDGLEEKSVDASFITLGNTASGALSWQISNVVTTNGSSTVLPSNWLVIPNGQQPARLQLSNIQWSAVNNSNLNGTGGAGTYVASNSFDNSGEVQENTSTGFTLTFTTPYPFTPQCDITNTGGLSFTRTVTATSFTVAHASNQGAYFHWNCTLGDHN